MYQVILAIKYEPICVVLLKSITQVCKFLMTVNFDIVDVDVISPRNVSIDVVKLLEVWNA